VWAAPDDALLAGMAAGDRDAVVAFVRRFQRRVFGLAVAVVGDPVLAEDVAQEAFLRAWRNAATFDTRRGSVTSWLLTVTRNLAIDAIRLRRAEPVDPDALVAMHLPTNEATPADIAVAHEQVSRLAAALRRLPEEQRRAVVLAGIGGRTAREVGELEDVPVGTAKTRIRTAMIKLRESLLAEHDSDWLDNE
jgi:RNA polymerase sigma-70 factor (ECF subfamily)